MLLVLRTLSHVARSHYSYKIKLYRNSLSVQFMKIEINIKGINAHNIYYPNKNNI